MNVCILQTALQKFNTINEILFFIISHTCYIYPTTMSGNLKLKRCANDTEFKVKIVQYANNCICNNKRQCFREATERLAKVTLDLAETP